MSDTSATSETSAAQAARPRGRAVNITLWVLQALLALQLAMGGFLKLSGSLPEEAAQGFFEAELGHPEGELVLFTVRPDRWLTADFSDDLG